MALTTSAYIAPRFYRADLYYLYYIIYIYIITPSTRLSGLFSGYLYLYFALTNAFNFFFYSGSLTKAPCDLRLYAVPSLAYAQIRPCSCEMHK